MAACRLCVCLCIWGSNLKSEIQANISKEWHRKGWELDRLFFLTILWNFGPSVSLSKHCNCYTCTSEYGRNIEGLSFIYKENTIRIVSLSDGMPWRAWRKPNGLDFRYYLFSFLVKIHVWKTTALQVASWLRSPNSSQLDAWSSKVLRNSITFQECRNVQGHGNCSPPIFGW